MLILIVQVRKSFNNQAVISLGQIIHKDVDPFN